MKTYLVGGAVRDGLLGLRANERDWVVVGGTPEAMAENGFKPVGKDFPVFLHPDTKEEYALARTERKSGRGYHGFSFHTGPEVTLEDDLSRRDLTVNAMARDDSGALIDPHGGQRDLEARLLRHVSPAFLEDPVRVLRVARFHSRFAPLGFCIADETMDLMKEMVANDEVDHLVPERVWQEMARALMQEQPSTFFYTLRECGALERLLPEVDALFGVPQRADYHPEVDSGIHTLMCVDAGARANVPLPVRAAALLHDLGKAKTPASQLPSHKMHDARGVPLVKQLCERLRLPAECRDLAIVHTREHLRVHVVRDMRPDTLLDLLEKTEAFRQGPRFDYVLQACECDARGRTGFEDCEYPQTDYLREARAVAAAVQAADVMQDGLEGPAVGKALKQKRVEALAAWKKTKTPPDL